MIFFLVMPGLFASYGNIMVPIYLGASDVCYPRINALSVFIVPVSYYQLSLTLYAEFSLGTGWTLYPPLSTSLLILTTVGVDVLFIGLLCSGIASNLASINLSVSIQSMNTYGQCLVLLSTYNWSIGTTSYLLLVVLPILTSALILMVQDLHYNTVFYDFMFGGDPIFYQHVFWFFGHPEVYILVLPAFGILSTVLITTINVNMFGIQCMILAMGCI